MMADAGMIDTPRGMLRFVSLYLLSQSSLSGKDLSEQIQRISSGLWKPSPGSIYPILSSMLREGLIIEVPRKEGNIRRYIVTSKGKQVLQKLQKEAESSATRQLRLVSIVFGLIGKRELKESLNSLLEELDG
jgi:DNA-binding PadR family transcriptional regulator